MSSQCPSFTVSMWRKLIFVISQIQKEILSLFQSALILLWFSAYCFLPITGDFKTFFGLKVLLKLKENYSFSSQRKIHLKLHDQYLNNPYLPGILVKITLRNRNHITYLSRENFNIKLFISKIRSRLIVWVKRKLKSKRKAHAMHSHLEPVPDLPTLKIEARSHSSEWSFAHWMAGQFAEVLHTGASRKTNCYCGNYETQQ